MVYNLMITDQADEFLCRKEYREALMPDMSYRIVFWIEMQTVYIVGVFHDLEHYGRKMRDV